MVVSSLRKEGNGVEPEVVDDRGLGDVEDRNDDHGGNLLGRMQAFVNNWLNQARRFGLASELIIVEWNPPPDRPKLQTMLRWPASCACTFRFIEVPPELHRILEFGDALPLFQMIGKNVGIRRARGRFVLSTNVDIILSNELIDVIPLGEAAAVVHFWCRLTTGAAHPAGPHAVDTLIQAVLTRRDYAWKFIAVENVTRQVAKAIEDCRLGSYTEKSTRYVPWDRDRCFRPEEDFGLHSGTERQTDAANFVTISQRALIADVLTNGLLDAHTYAVSFAYNQAEIDRAGLVSRYTTTMAISQLRNFPCPRLSTRNAPCDAFSALSRA